MIAPSLEQHLAAEGQDSELARRAQALLKEGRLEEAGEASPAGRG